MHRILLLTVLLSCMSVLSVCGCTAPCNANLNVATFSNYAVVADGVLDPKWDPTQQGPYPTSSILYPHYQITYANAIPATNFQFTITYTSLNDTIVNTSLPNEAGACTGAVPTYLTLAKTQCVSSGTGTIKVDLAFIGPAVTVVSWSYTKTCVVPVIQVGTAPWDSDVVDGSAPVAAFANYPFPVTTMNLYMFLANPPPMVGTPIQQPFTVSAVSADESSVTLGVMAYNTSSAEVPGPEGYYWQTSDKPIGMLSIPFNCIIPGSQTNITLTIDYHYASGPLVIVFLKQCFTKDNFDSLSIGTTASDNDIADQGVPAQAWNPSSTSGKGKMLTPDSALMPQNVFTFHLCNACKPGSPVQQPQPYTVSINVEDTAVLDIFLRSGSAGVLPTTSDIPVVADVFCKSAGFATVNFMVDIGVKYQPVPFTFTYHCVFPLLDVGYTAYNNTIALAAVRTQVLAPWNGTNPYVIPVDEDTSYFWIYMDSANDNNTIQHQFYQISFAVNPTEQLQPDVVDQSGGVAYFPSAGMLPVAVNWHCLETAINSPVSMSIRYGWFGTQTMQFTFIKSCSVVPPPPASGGGWGAAGIFFFTLFILTLVLCISGCGWNYCREEKRGWEIVPLYTTCSGCYDKMTGTDKQWTPQMDTDSGSSGKRGGKHGVTSYGNFEDSGASYQANL